MADRAGPPPGESGHALFAVLVAISLLTPLAAFAYLQAHSELETQRHNRTATELFWAAESGIEQALADLELDPSFDRLTAGPDGLAGTADDGEFPFQHPPPANFPRLSAWYEVRVEDLGGGAVEIISTATADGAVTRTMIATVSRSPTKPQNASFTGWREEF